MTRPIGDVSALASSGADYFLSREFLQPYGDDFFAYFAPYRRPAAASAKVRGALLQAETYLADALDAQISGDDAKLVNALEVAAGLLAVALGAVRKSSPSETRTLQ
jgi:hypothetical protein